MDISQDVLAHWLSLARHTPLGVICDLDGTLLPFVATPSESQLPPALAELLSGLAALPGLVLVIVSGRPREDLERLLAQQFWASEKVEEPRGIKVGSYCA